MDNRNSLNLSNSTAQSEVEKELKKQNQLNKDVFLKLKEWLEKQNEGYEEFLQNIKNSKYYKESTKLKKLVFGAIDYDKYKTAEKYAAKKQSIMQDPSYTQPQKYAAYGYMSGKEAEEQAELNGEGLLAGAMDKTVDEFTNGLQEMIFNYKSFKDTMKSIGLEISQYMLSQVTDTMLKMVFNQKNAMAALQGASKGFNWLKGAGGNVLKGLGSLFTTHHSGGIVPDGANYSLPGTEEQLALLKGGERILSPAENTNYSSNGQSSASPVVFNNFNIKAWDSKDVRKYLLENKDLLNSITFEGIKYNNKNLRNMVRGA